MKVSEVIEALSAYPLDAEVVYKFEEYDDDPESGGDVIPMFIDIDSIEDDETGMTIVLSGKDALL